MIKVLYSATVTTYGSKVQHTNVVQVLRSDEWNDIPQLRESAYKCDVDELGEGKFGTVKKCQFNLEKIDSEDWAIIKTFIQGGQTDYAFKFIRIPKGNLLDVQTSQSKILQEINITEKLPRHCDNVIKHYGAFRNIDRYGKETGVVLIMEFVEGKELFNVINDELKSAKPKLDFVSKLEIIKQVADGLFDLHSARILHLDIKLENILIIEKPLGKYGVKIIDFGFSRQITDDNQAIQGKVGTIGYLAPEVALGDDYTYQADMWSFAVVVVILMSDGRHHPWIDRSDESLESTVNLMKERFDKGLSIKRIESESLMAFLSNVFFNKEGGAKRCMLNPDWKTAVRIWESLKASISSDQREMQNFKSKSQQKLSIKAAPKDMRKIPTEPQQLFQQPFPITYYNDKIIPKHISTKIQIQNPFAIAHIQRLYQQRLNQQSRNKTM